MAKKYGSELRNELKFRDHGGQIINQGDLYLADQLIAFWSQDMWGGADILKMEKNYSEASFREAILGKHPAPLTIRYGDYVISVEYSLELMMNELVKLTDAENIFHRALDKGYNALLFVTDNSDKDALEKERVLVQGVIDCFYEDENGIKGTNEK